MTTEEFAKFKAYIDYVEKDFTGVCGNPVTFAAKWGLPLSRSYLKYLDERNAVAHAKPRKVRKARRMAKRR